MAACARCGTENAGEARFCSVCGASLVAAQSEVRKTVTVVFNDLSGSTALGERLDAESVRRLLGRYFEEARATLESYGGTVEKFVGDAVMAVFGSSCACGIHPLEQLPGGPGELIATPWRISGDRGLEMAGN
jgi:hypothetical protein